MITQVEVTEMEETKKNEIEEMKKKMLQTTNEASLIIMGMDKELSELEVGRFYCRLRFFDNNSLNEHLSNLTIQVKLKVLNGVKYWQLRRIASKQKKVQVLSF